MNIGLLGEAPFDTTAIENLLLQKYSENIKYITLLNDVTGSNLDNAKMIKRARRQYEKYQPEFVVYFRDLDSSQLDREKILYRKMWFNKINQMMDKKCFFLLFIYEIEALLFADIETTNKFYNTEIEGPGNPMEIPKPKEAICNLIKQTNIDTNIFHELNYEVLKMNYPIFDNFINQFEQKINNN